MFQNHLDPIHIGQDQSFYISKNCVELNFSDWLIGDGEVGMKEQLAKNYQQYLSGPKIPVLGKNCVS